MGNQSSYRQYQRTQIETASQKQLILMLYDGAIRFLHTAKEGIAREDLELAHNALIRSQAIILELLSGLNQDSGEITQGLTALYDYFYQRLVEANRSKDTDIIDEVIPYLQELREVWAQIKEGGQNGETKEEERVSEKISLRG